MKAYFFVITPLNYLYALQASLDDRFAFEEKHLIVLSDYNRSLKQFNNIIDEKQWTSIQFPLVGSNKNAKSKVKSFLFEIYNKIFFLLLFKKITKSNSTLFWGNYNHKYSKYLKKYKNQIFFLDDGFSTINILRKLEQQDSSIDQNFKLSFYTTFNFHSTKIDIQKHQLESISKNNYEPFLTNCIYFLGQPLVFNNVISEKNYINSIDNIFNFYSIKGMKCYYLAHRSTNRDYIPKNWNVLNLNFPVEFLHLIESNKTPNSFITFYSTGVFNLKHIHKLNHQQYEFWELPSDWINPEYRTDIEAVYYYLKSNDFLVKNLLEINTKND